MVNGIRKWSEGSWYIFMLEWGIVKNIKFGYAVLALFKAADRGEVFPVWEVVLLVMVAIVAIGLSTAIF